MPCFIRKCVVCNVRRKKNEFFRVVKLKTNDKTNGEFKVFVDETLKSNGRGAYICKNEKCLEIARKKRSFSRAFRGKVDDQIYDSLKNLFKSLQF